MLLILITVMDRISSNGMTAISSSVSLMIFFNFLALFLPPFMFLNFKLFTIVSRKVHRGRTVSPGMRTTINFKNISMGLWAVASFLLLYIPNSFYIAFSLAEKPTRTLRLPMIRALRCVTINCILNSLIFFWKNWSKNFTDAVPFLNTKVIIIV